MRVKFHLATCAIAAALLALWGVSCESLIPASPVPTPTPTISAITVTTPSSSTIPSVPAASPTPTPAVTQVTPSSIPKVLPARYQGPLLEGQQAILGIGAIDDAAVSPDGRWLAVVSSVGLNLYQAGTFKWQWTNPNIFFTSKTQWLPDSNSLALSDSFDVSILNVATGHIIRTLTVYDTYTDVSPYYGGWQSIVMSPDGTSFALASEYGLIVWDLDSNTFKHLLKTDKGEVNNLVWLPGGHRLAASHAGSTFIWDTDSGQILSTLMGAYEAWSPDFNTAIVSDGASSRAVWDVETNTRRYTVDQCATPSPDWSLIVSCMPGGLAVRNGLTGETLQTIDIPAVTGIQPYWSPDGSLLAFRSGNSIEVWNVKTGQVQSMLTDLAVTHNDTSDQHIWLTWSPDNQVLFSDVSDDQAISVWNVNTGTREQVFWRASGEVSFIANQPELILTQNSTSISLWELSTGNVVKELDGFSSTGEIGWSSDSSTLAIAEDLYEKYIVEWNAKTGEPTKIVDDVDTQEFNFRLTQDHSTTISPDGSRSVTGTADISDARVTLIDAKSQITIAEIHESYGGGSDSAPSMYFGWSPDSHILVINLGGTIYFVDATTGQSLGSLPGWAKNFAFSPNSKLIATNGLDTVTIWKVPS